MHLGFRIQLSILVLAGPLCLFHLAQTRLPAQPTQDDGQVVSTAVSASARPTPSPPPSLVRFPPAQLLLPAKPFYQNNAKINFKPLTEALLSRGWKRPPRNNRSPGPALVLVGDVQAAAAARRAHPAALINSLGLKECMWGDKSKQVLCRERLAESHGCSLDSLEVQPVSFSMSRAKACRQFFAAYESERHARSVWIGKPAGNHIGHGEGIRLFAVSREDDTAYLRAHFGACEESSTPTTVLSRYVSDAALLHGHKFDVRTFCLVASASPFLVFYHDGFARRAAASGIN